MKFIIIGKNIDVTPGLREAVESKLGKLGRYFTPNTEIHVTLSVQKGHQKIEVTIPVKGGLVRSEQESSDMYVSIDLVEEVIERQLRKYKNKIEVDFPAVLNFRGTLPSLGAFSFHQQILAKQFDPYILTNNELQISDSLCGFEGARTKVIKVEEKKKKMEIKKKIKF